MRFAIWALVALIVGALGAHFLLLDRGYVLISFLGWNVEMSVPGLALMLILFYVAVRVLVRVLSAPGQIGDALEAHRTRRVGSRLARGLSHMTAGDDRGARDARACREDEAESRRHAGASGGSPAPASRPRRSG